MSIAESPPATLDTLAELLQRLGDVPNDRIMVGPVILGRANEVDVIEIRRRTGRLFELVDGVLVEKAMGYGESVLAILLGGLLNRFILPRNLGLVSGEAGMVRLFPGLVYIPDVAFASWDRFPGRRYPTALIPDLAPDLVVEILSHSNTLKEMDRKRRDYFRAGVRLVWIIDPADRTARAYTDPDRFDAHDESGTLDGGDVLPGLALPLRELFGLLDRKGDD